jgi:hypothetical protein
MLTSRSVPQQIEQIVSPLAGQKRFALRFWQIGQINSDLTRRSLARPMEGRYYAIDL